MTEHLDEILAAISPMASLELPLADAHGCRLAFDVRSGVDLPPWDNSGMDGYAVRLSDVLGASERYPAELPVIADIAAGSVADGPVMPGSCARIMTGAPVPAGAEAVVPVEATDGGTATVAIHAAPQPGQHIRRRGDDVTVGQLLVSAGTTLGPAHLGLLAAAGRSRVPVAPRPRVVVLSTGDELTEPGEQLGAGRIHESNSYMLAAAAREAGAVGYRVGIVPDEEDTVLAAVEDQLSRADLIVTTGGVSAGAYDVVKAVLSKLGTVWFGPVAMNPGKPQGFGCVGPSSTPIFTLPGNPVSAYVSFEVFVRPALRRMLDVAPATRPRLRATCTETFSSPPGKTQFARGWLDRSGEPGAAQVRPVGGAGSHLLEGLARANCLIVVGADTDTVTAGSPVEVMELGASGGDRRNGAVDG